MPTGQQYATNVPQTTLTVGISATATSFNVTSLASWPTPPFTAVIDLGNSNQEPIDVLSVTGNTINTCTRNIDGTSGFTHGANATFTHADIGRDFREPRAHIDSSGPTDGVGHNVHGLTAAGSVVLGTLDTQPVANKTYVGVSGLTGAATATRYAGGSAGGPPTTGTFVTGDVVLDTVAHGIWMCSFGGTPGNWVPVGGRFLLSSSALTTGSVTVNLPSYASNFTNLVIEIYGRDSTAGGSLSLQFNGDTGSHYGYVENFTRQGDTQVFTNSSASTTSISIGLLANSGSTSGGGLIFVDIPQFNSTSFRKSIYCRSSAGDGASASAAGGILNTFQGTWQSTAAITSVTLVVGGPSTLTGSVMNIYGTN